MRDIQGMRRYTLAPVLLLLAGLLLTGLGAFFTPASAVNAAPESAAGPAVYVVQVTEPIESGLQSFLERAYREAEAAQAERVILVIDTLGGLVQSAEDIGELIRGSKIPTVAFIKNKAVSAGTFIAMNAKQIVMQPGSTIGAAAIVDGSGNLIENPKYVSFWTAEMKKAAELNGRNPDIAVAMVDPTQRIEIPELGDIKEKGEILTLTDKEAVKVGYADHIASSVDETIKWMGLEGRTVVEVSLTPSERLAGWLTTPGIMTLLLILGIAGIAMEMIIPGFGVPGIVGILAFALYFFGHYVAGFAGIESIVLFVIGVALLIIELFVPSFGILGILGIVSLVTGVATAAFDTKSALLSLVIAFLAAALIVGIMAKIFKHKGIWNRFILRDRLTKEKGYVPAASKDGFLGLEGITLTPLRPAGAVLLGEERVDVVTFGEFIAAGKSVKVVKVEGTRVIVREIV